MPRISDDWRDLRPSHRHQSLVRVSRDNVVTDWPSERRLSFRAESAAGETANVLIFIERPLAGRTAGRLPVPPPPLPHQAIITSSDYYGIDL